jgi:hypothetical protein
VICAQCRTTNDADDAFCRNCGTRLSGPAPYQAGKPADQGIAGSTAPYQRLGDDPAHSAMDASAAGRHAVGTAHPATAFRLDLRRLSQVERVVGGASVVVLISLFLPWFGFSVLGESFTVSGLTAHGYLYVLLILTLVILAYLVLRAGWDQLPFSLPIAHGPLLLIGTGLQFLLVLIGFLDKPLSVLSWEVGAYLGLVAAAVAAGPVIVPAIKSFQASR